MRPDNSDTDDGLAGESVAAAADPTTSTERRGDPGTKGASPTPGFWRPHNYVALLAVFTCVILSASPVSLTPGDGLDRSWLTALNLARPNGFRFGRDILFTYGPWGYLDYPTASSRLNLVLGSLFAAVSVVVAWRSIWRAFQRFLARDRAAWAATALVVLMIPAGGASAMLLIGVTVALLDVVGHREARGESWHPVAASACAALLLQVKFSEGAVLIPMVAVTCLFARRGKWRSAVECMTTFVVCSVVFWLLAGQRMGDFPSWVEGSIRISRGYTEAMALETDPNSLGYVMLIILSLTVLFTWAKSVGRNGLGTALGTAAIGGMLMYLGLKEGFGRHDVGHEAFFYLLTAPVLLWMAGSGRVSTLRLFPVFLTVAFGLNGFLHTNVEAVRSRWATELEILTDRQYQSVLLETSKAQARASYKVPPEILTKLVGPVAVDGWEAALPWAYGLTWEPAPVFQSYVAYTHWLDTQNRNWLLGSDATQKILRPLSTGIDGRNSLWDPPAYVVSEMCTFQPFLSSNEWLALEKTFNRCGEAQSIREDEVQANESIRPPAVGANQLLTMSFVPRPTNPIVAIVRLTNKSFGQLRVTVDGTRFRLPRDLATGPLVVSVPTSLGWPSQFGGTTTYQSLSFSEAGTVRFEVRDVA